VNCHVKLLASGDKAELKVEPVARPKRSTLVDVLHALTFETGEEKPLVLHLHEDSRRWPGTLTNMTPVQDLTHCS
jgi:hypothetical protein